MGPGDLKPMETFHSVKNNCLACQGIILGFGFSLKQFLTAVTRYLTEAPS